MPCESLHTISVAPAAIAPSMAALTSPSSSRRPSSYGCPGARHCDQSTIPATPSMSNEMKTFTEDHYRQPDGRGGAHPAGEASQRWNQATISRPVASSSSGVRKCPTPGYSTYRMLAGSAAYHGSSAA